MKSTNGEALDEAMKASVIEKGWSISTNGESHSKAEKVVW